MKFCYNTNFTLNNSKDLDPSYKTDLDLWDWELFWKEKTLSYNRRNMVTLLDWKPALGTCTNSVDLDQMLQNAASDQGLHCFLKGISMRNTIRKKTFMRNRLD